MEPSNIYRKPILIWLIASQILALGSLVFWLMIAGLSVMAFDSGKSPQAWAFVIAIWSYPISPIGFSIAAWIVYACKKDKTTGILTTFTFLLILILFIVIIARNFIYSWH